MTSPLQDDEYLREARKQATPDPFLAEAQRQASPRPARQALRQSISELRPLPSGGRGGMGRPIAPTDRAAASYIPDVATQTARGLAESGLATARGAERLFGNEDFTPGHIDMEGVYHEPEKKPIHATPVERLTEEIRDTYGEPKSGPGAVAQFGGRIAGDVAQYAAGTRLLGAAGLLPEGEAVGTRIARGVIGAAPVDVAQSAGSPEQSTLGAAAELSGSPALKRASESTPARVATEVAIGGALNTITEILPSLIRRARGLGKVREADRLEELANEASKLSAKPKRSARQNARLRELAAEIDGLEKQLEPPPPVEQSAMAPTQDRAADVAENIIEQEKAAERRKVSVPVETERRAVPVGDEFDQAAREADALSAAPEVRRSASSVGAKKFKKMDDAALEQRYHAVLDRMQAKGNEAWEGTTPWVRKEERSRDAGTSGARGFGGYSRETGVIQGRAVTGKAGRAIGRMKDDARIAAELEAEFEARGIKHDDVLERYLARTQSSDEAAAAAERGGMQSEAEGSVEFPEPTLDKMDTQPGPGNRRGFANRRLAALLGRTSAGTVIGGTAGAQVGDTPAERRRNAIIGALSGAIIAGGVPAIRDESGKIKAFHGSPHNFDRFDIKKIGSGEGAASYGHGLYFAENKEVAEDYRRRLAGTRRHYEVDGKPIDLSRDPTGAESQAIHMYSRQFPAAEEANYVRSVRASSSGEFLEQFNAALEKYQGKQVRAVERPAGHVYAADIEAEPHEMLDWDKPVREQPPPARDALNRLIHADGEFLEANMPADKNPPEIDDGTYTAGEVYRLFSRVLDGGAEEVSERLARNGVKGIRYLDQGSRSTYATWRIIPAKESVSGKWTVGPGGPSATKAQQHYFDTEAEARAFYDSKRIGETHNYVVFDDKLLNITERGAASPAAVRALAGAGLGAATGAAVDKENRTRGALIGGAAGAGLGAASARLGRSGIISAVPEVGREAAERLGQTVARSTGPINPDEFVNVAKFALDPAGEKRLRAEVSEVVATHGLAPKQRVTWTETKRMAATLGLRPADIVQREASRLNGAEMLAIRNIVSTNIDAVEGMSKRLADATITPELREKLERAITGLEGQNSALLERFVQARSSAGRDLNNLKILANRTMDPVTWLVKAQRLTGDAGFTPEVRTNVLRLINTGDKAGLVRYLAGVRTSPWYEKLTTLWKAGLLTNPKTHVVNVTSNMTMAALETAKDNPAVVYDRLMSLWTGEITKAPTTVATLAASARGARDGAKEAMQVLRGTGADDALRRFDIPHEVNFDNVILDTYTKTVFRLLGAEDKIFRGAALRRSLSEQARVLASREGLSGAKRSARVAELLHAPTDEMVTTAIRDAEVATFTDPTELSNAISGFFGRIKSPAFKTAAEVVLPFKRTPSAVATRVFEYSPFGFVGGAADAWKVFRAASKGKPVTALQKRAAERLGRATTGASAIAIGMWLYEKGRATGAAPTFSSKEAQQWRTEGKQPNSVLINGKWHNVGRLSPLGNMIALGANLRAAMMAKEDETVAGRLAELGASTVRTVADQPFVTGVRSATEAVLDPKEQAAQFLTGLAGSVVPAGVAAAARTIDPTVRKASGVQQTIQSRIPGVSKSLLPQRDVFGAEATREPGVIANILDPTSPSSDVRERDPLVRELSRVGAAIGRLKREHGETPEAYDQRQVTYGQRLRTRLERVVRGPGYQRADRERQVELIDDAVQDLRRDMTRRRHRRAS